MSSKKSKITRIDKWDVPASRPCLKGGNIPHRNLSSHTAIHKLGTTLTATASLLADRDFVLNIVGINNR